MHIQCFFLWEWLVNTRVSDHQKKVQWEKADAGAAESSSASCWWVLSQMNWVVWGCGGDDWPTYILFYSHIYIRHHSQ